MGNDPVYVKSRCFETFPFPTPETGLTPALSARIASLADDIDAHRKRALQPTAALPPPPAGEGWGGGSVQQSSVDSAREVPPPPPSPAGGGSKTVTRAASNCLTLTGLYNVLEALREGRALTAKEKAIHDAGLVAVLKSLHDELDACVLAALQRVDEEASGNIAWLRPAYQNPTLRGTAVEAVATQTTLAIDTPQVSDAVAAPTQRSAAKARKLVWPRTLPERMKTVAMLLAESAAPLTTKQIYARIDAKKNQKTQLPDILATLVALGRAQQVNDTQFAAV